jgi:hypothetical protein
MTMHILNPDNKPSSLRVDATGALITSGSGGGGGTATEAKQDTGNASLASIDAKTPALSSGKVPVTDPTALPLPSGAATAARQDTGNTSLASLDTKMSTLLAQTDGIEASLSSMDTKLTQLGKSGGREYETVAASQTDQIMGATGAAGDYIEGLICVVSTAATSQVQIKDGAGSAITVLPNSVGPGVGTYYVPLGLTATGAGWRVTTAAGVSVIALGDFT